MVIFYGSSFRYEVGTYSNGKPRLSPVFKSLGELFAYKAKQEGKDISEYKFRECNLNTGRGCDRRQPWNENDEKYMHKMHDAPGRSRKEDIAKM